MYESYREAVPQVQPWFSFASFMWLCSRVLHIHLYLQTLMSQRSSHMIDSETPMMSPPPPFKTPDTKLTCQPKEAGFLSVGGGVEGVRGKE